jgi:hypothetical protein
MSRTPNSRRGIFNATVWNLLVPALAAATGAALAMPSGAQDPNQPKPPDQRPPQVKQRNEVLPQDLAQKSEIRGRIVRTDKNMIVVQTPDNREVVLHTRPETKFLQKDQIVALTDFQVGTNIIVAYGMDGARYLANRVSLAETEVADPRPVPPAAALHEIEGRIVRTGPDQVVIETADRRQVVVYRKPETKFLASQAIRFNELQVGQIVTAIAATEGDTMSARMVVTAPALTGAAPPPVVAAPAAESTDRTMGIVDGVVARVIAPDRIDVQAMDESLVSVYMDAATTFLFGGRSGRFSDMQAGDKVSIEYTVRDKRNIAKRVVGVISVEGQVIRTAGQDQLVLRGADGREITVFVNPETRYRLTPAGGAFTDLRPGASISIFYDHLDRRNQARYIFIPEKRPVRR